MSARSPVLDPAAADRDTAPSRAAPPRQLHARIDAACEQACASITAAWPLDRAIAVNPHWKRVGRPLREVAARMAVLAGVRVFPSRELMREAWERGRIDALALHAALEQLPAAREAGWNAARCVAVLREPVPTRRLPLLIELLDDEPADQARLSWRQAVTHQVSQTCAAWFDRRQADWQPERDGGLYDFWRDAMHHDHGIGVLMGLPGLRRGLAALPPSREAAEHWALQRLGLPESCWADYLESVLLTMQGWASWCAYVEEQARLEGGSRSQLRDLLAIRLAWGAMLLECKEPRAAQPAFAAMQSAWSGCAHALREAQQALLPDEVWQLAFDLGYQRELIARLDGAARPTPSPVEVQAVFCIDVRSERLRRALESVWPAVQTFGFAGFFGVPASYTPLATAATRPQLPGLLAPTLELREHIVAPTGHEPSVRLDAAAGAARRRHFAMAWPADGARRWPAAAFSYVESAGFSYLGALARWLRPSTAARVNDDQQGLPARYRPLCRPLLSGLDDSARLELATRVLRAMGLQRDFAPLVLLAAHASQSSNNAHAAALDCGACCGNSGEVNARALAQLLNEPRLRDALRDGGIEIPRQTVFVAALHNTTTDEVEGFDLDLLPAHALARWQRLREVLAHACDQARRERAPGLGLDARLRGPELLRRLRRRANDGAQTRPEWGLAGNAALILAPRARSRGALLGGRCFLHDYDASLDADGSLLEALMTAPLLVAHWINWQYHASTCEPERLGSGNKLLHNVVGGNIGVFEGNGGDLRIGLARQSLHDGTRWVHEPLRLAVLIEASEQAIERVLERHAQLRDLADNGWLHLLRIDASGAVRRRVRPQLWVAA